MAKVMFAGCHSYAEIQQVQFRVAEIVHSTPHTVPYRTAHILHNLNNFNFNVDYNLFIILFSENNYYFPTYNILQMDTLYSKEIHALDRHTVQTYVFIAAATHSCKLS